MSLEAELNTRAEEKCELCNTTDGLVPSAVEGSQNSGADAHILTCSTCNTQILSNQTPDPIHWRCLNESAWSQTPAVQVSAWRMLNRLSS